MTELESKWKRRQQEAATSVSDRIKWIIVDQLGVGEAEVTPSAFLHDDLGADSLDAIELIMAIEEAFDITIPDEDGEKMRTVQDVLTYLAGKVVA